MNKEKINELKDKSLKIAKEEFENMKSAGLDITDNINKKNDNDKKKFYFGIGGFVIIVLFIFVLIGGEEEDASGNYSSTMCAGKYYYIRTERGERIQKCSSKCWYQGNVPMCSWGLFGMEEYTVDFFEDRTGK